MQILYEGIYMVVIVKSRIVLSRSALAENVKTTLIRNNIAHLENFKLRKVLLFKFSIYIWEQTVFWYL